MSVTDVTELVTGPEIVLMIVTMVSVDLVVGMVVVEEEEGAVVGVADIGHHHPGEGEGTNSHKMVYDMQSKNVFINIRRCGMSANETNLCPTHNLLKVIHFVQRTAFNTELWLILNSKFLRSPKK